MTGLDRFLRFTSEKEPVLSIGLVAAIALAIADRFLNLSDGDLAIYGPIAVLVVSVIMRRFVYSPASYQEDVQAALETEPPK